MFDSAYEDTVDDEGPPRIPKQTLILINDAFNKAINEAQQKQGVRLAFDDGRPAKRRRLSPTFVNDEGGEGGFLPTEESFTDAGGFLVESTDQSNPDEMDGESDNEHSWQAHEHIPLSLIPHALQILDLNPSDSQILSVFKNASERPSLSDTKAWSRDEEGGLEDVISWSDFRAVCAALLPDALKGRSSLDDEDDSDHILDETGSSEDEYVPESKTSRKGGKKSNNIRGRTSQSIPERSLRSQDSRRTKTKNSKGNDSDASTTTSTPSTTRKLTARQERDTLMAYSLFFPSLRIGGNIENDVEEGKVNETLLRRKQLAIKDIADAATLIKEKLKAEEIIEMISFFSKTPNAQANPTMSFPDFQEMMTTTKLA